MPQCLGYAMQQTPSPHTQTHTHMHALHLSQSKQANQGPSLCSQESREKGKIFLFDKKMLFFLLFFLGRSFEATISCYACYVICFTLREHVMWRSWYLFSHYDMGFGALRKRMPAFC